jgi:hypothetical protein
MKKTYMHRFGTLEYLAHAPWEIILDEDGHLLEPGLTKWAAFEHDHRYALKLASEIASGETQLFDSDELPYVVLVTRTDRWPNDLTLPHELKSAHPSFLHRRIHVEFIGSEIEERTFDFLERLIGDKRPALVVVDEFELLRTPDGPNTEAYFDAWAKARGVIVFGVNGS